MNGICRQTDAHAYAQKYTQTHGRPMQLNNKKTSLYLSIEIHQIGSILCRLFTCHTQYALNFMVAVCVCRVYNILFFKEYGPRGSILCREHFVALQDTHFH